MTMSRVSVASANQEMNFLHLSGTLFGARSGVGLTAFWCTLISKLFVRVYNNYYYHARYVYKIATLNNFRRWAPVTKIKLGEKLTKEIFSRQKFSKLWYGGY